MLHARAPLSPYISPHSPRAPFSFQWRVFAPTLVPEFPSTFLSQPRITFGSGGDIKPLSLTVAENHCVVIKEGGEEGGEASDSAPATYTLECGEGETFVNGR